MNLLCWIFGHRSVRQFGGGRVWTKCEWCNWESPGLGREKDGPKPRKVKYRTLAERQVAPTKVLPMKTRRRA
jgi:hypothetical protein